MDETLVDKFAKQAGTFGLSEDQFRQNLSNIQSGSNIKKTRDVVPVIDGSQVGNSDLNVDSSLNTSKRDSAIARIRSTPAQTQGQSVDIFGEVLKGASPEDQDLVKQLLSQADSLTGGKFTSLGEQALGGLFGAQVDQRDRKKETARLQEQAGLPELESEFAAITSEFNTLESARNSRLINETGKVAGLTKQQINDRQNEIQRQYGLQVADNRISELAVAGKINAATQLIDAKMDLKYGDLEAEIDLYTSQLNAIQPFMDKEQQKLAEQRQFALQQASNVINDARNRDKELELTKAQAIKNARDRGASLQQIAQIQDAKNVQEVAATGFTTSALEQAQLAGQRLSNRASLLSLASNGDASAIEQLGYDPRQVDLTPQDIMNVEQTAASIRDDISTVESLKNNKQAINLSAGTLKGGFFASFLETGTGSRVAKTIKEDFLSDVERLTGAYTLDNLIAKKAEGATFGALSNAELGIISASASSLNSKLDIDPQTGEITGIRGSEEGLRQALEDFEQTLVEAQDKNNARLLSSDELAEIVNTQ